MRHEVKLSADEIALITEIKEHGSGLDALIAKLMAFGPTDQRWIAIGKTNLQQGIMALVRSVARPDGF